MSQIVAMMGRGGHLLVYVVEVVLRLHQVKAGEDLATVDRAWVKVDFENHLDEYQNALDVACLKGNQCRGITQWDGCVL